MLLLVGVLIVGVSPQQYTKHLTPINYEVPHEVIFRDERCWVAEEGEVTVPRNCSGNYCSQCYYNTDIRDYRNHLMSYNDNRLIVAALDYLLSFDVTDNLFEKIQTADSSPSAIDPQAKAGCLGTGRAMESCRNYNRVLLSLSEQGSLLTCGTTAYSIENSCQIRSVKDLKPFSPIKGEGFVPMNENAWNTALYTDSRVFAGTLISSEPSQNFFTISSAKINTMRNEFNTVVSTLANAAWLNRAKFVASFASGDYAYFLFQELNYEELNPGKKQVVSRIARVCKEDVGLETNDIGLEGARLWNTFVKSRIYCNNKVIDKTFGDQIFTYNRIGDGVLDVSGDKRTLYAAFSEGDTTASGSVVCRFDLNAIDQNFDTSLYYKFSSTATQTTRTKPTCTAMADAVSADIYSLHLTVTDVWNADPPLFLQSGPQFTKLIIDSNLRNLTNPVLFIGTNMGKVLKVTWTDKDDGTMQPILIEALQVAVGDINSDLTVNFLAFEKTIEPNYLFVGTGVSVSKIVISRCLRIPSLSRNCCFASRDPYCGWCEALGKCSSRQDCSTDWTQSLTADVQDTCPGPTTAALPTLPPPTKPPPPPPTEPRNESEPSKSIKPTYHPASEPEHNKTETPKKPTTSASQSSDAAREHIVSDSDSWKTVAIVMAILCGIFVLISGLLALNLARRWCSANRKPPLKSANNNLQHNYNPLSMSGAKSEDVSDRIPVYNTRSSRTNNNV